MRVFVALGSNLNSPITQLNSACQALQNHSALYKFACSPYYRSIAVGPPQADYINAVACFETNLGAHKLLEVLQSMENAQGRVRTQQWGPRTLDLDLLLYGDKTLATPDLIVPHPRLTERNFVLQPLLDLSPELVLPDGSLAATHLHRIGLAGLEKINEHPRRISL